MAFTIQHGQSAALLEALARVGGAIGDRQGRETARQQQDAAQQQAFENDLNNRQLAQQATLTREQQAGLNQRQILAGEQDLARTREQGRIDNYQINRQGALQQQRDAANNAAELSQRTLLETMQSAPPQVQRQISGILQQRSVIMSDPTLRPESRQQLLGELDQRVESVMQEARAFEQPSTEQWAQESFATLPDGTVVFRNPDGSMNLTTRPDQSVAYMERQERLQTEQTRLKIQDDARADAIAALQTKNDETGAITLPTRQQVDEYVALRAPSQQDNTPTISPEQAAQVALQHPVYGVVTQGDIIQTAKDSGMSVEDVVARLRQEGAQIPTSNMPQQQNTSVADLLRQ